MNVPNLIFRWTVIYLFSLFNLSRNVLGDDYAFFDIERDRSISSHSISSTTVTTEIECAVNCLHNDQCYAISFECQQIRNIGMGACYLKSEAVSPTSYNTVIDHSMCIATRGLPGPGQTDASAVQTNKKITSDGTATTTTTTTLTSTLASVTTAQAQTPVIAIVEGLQNRCTSSSQFDVAVVTTNGVNIYDTNSDITGPPCKTVTNALNIFTGFSNLPEISQWDAILTYQRTNIDLFANGQVWRWQSSGNSLQKTSGYPKSFSNYINSLYSRTPTNIPPSIVWAVHRSKTGGSDVYFNSGSDFYFYSNQPPYERVFQKTTSFNNQNGVSLNPWGQIPDNVVTVGYLDDQGKDFIIITDDSLVSFYVLDFNSNSQDPPISINAQGQLQIV